MSFSHKQFEKVFKNENKNPKWAPLSEIKLSLWVERDKCLTPKTTKDAHTLRIEYFKDDFGKKIIFLRPSLVSSHTSSFPTLGYRSQLRL